MYIIEIAITVCNIQLYLLNTTFVAILFFPTWEVQF